MAAQFKPLEVVVLKPGRNTDMTSLRTRRPVETEIDSIADVVPVPVLQQVQDTFSTALRIPLLFVSPDGAPVTKSSGLEMFCSQFTRKIQAKRPCAHCDRCSHGIAEAGAPQIYHCPVGLKDVSLAIRVADQVVGYLATALVTSEPGAPQIVEWGRKNGMTPAAALSYASRIPVETSERLTEVANGLAALVNIISELAATTRHIQLTAYTDPLTGLPNRVKFWERLSQELESAEQQNYPVSILLVDLDNFRTINTTFGHETGDQVLKSVARILAKEIRASDMVARYGSDSFLVILTYADPSGAEIVSWRLQNKISDCEVTAKGQKVPVSASVGHVTYPICAAHDPDALFTEVYAALKTASEPLKSTECRLAA